ncbi:hypothetical protein M153_12100001780 [Pseudoloma neurophilia]|uniref:Uncharacterized protein n=1 Tax=Pseudoloma neurophilia TaxID=146866 RepID=A0A0R0M2K9_9MICR|nr:hypothetical protein M153_12100001780 [Pseudoloma neurophilia]
MIKGTCIKADCAVPPSSEAMRNKSFKSKQVSSSHIFISIL